MPSIVVMLRSYSSNDDLAISHALFTLDDALVTKIRKRTAAFALAASMDTDNIYTVEFWDGSADFFESSEGYPMTEDERMDETSLVFLPSNFEHPEDRVEDERLNVKATRMVITQRGFKFVGYEKYSGSEVSTDEFSFHDLEKLIHGDNESGVSA